MPKPTPEEVLKAIEESEVDDEVERVLAMTPEQRRAELEAAGFDMKEVHAKADAFHARLQGGAETPAARDSARPSLRARWRRPARIGALAGAALLVFFAGMNGRALAAWIAGEPVRPDDTWLPWRPARTPWQHAVLLRMEALDACAQQDWTQCSRKLDEASILDPAGESSPSVQEARRRIASAEQQQELDTDSGRHEKPKPP
jgi:hypothetical protein